MQKRTQRILSLFLALLLMLSVFPASAAKASTIKLTKTTGTVTVTNASKRSQSTRVNMLLYSGYTVQTKASSYAWISLDSSKLSKLDASSKVSIRKSGSKLELLLKSGHIYFNVKSPLTSGETLNIRTSTMAVGIRGTCGWVKEIDEYTSELYLLEGTVQCAGADPASGEVKTETVRAGEKVIVTVKPQVQEGERCEITREKFTVSDIDEYVMEELVEDPDLCEDIYKDSGLDIQGTHEGEDQEFGPAGELVASGKAGENVTWELRGNTLTISGTGDMFDFNGLYDPPWYSYGEQKQIHTVRIENGVTSIGGWAFARENTSITSLTFPGSVTSIGYAAFRASNLTSVTIPNSVTSIGEEAFAQCTSLTSVAIGKGVTTIEYWTFYNCSSLTDVYYAGSEDDWSAISVEAGNDPLTSANIHYKG